MDDAKSYGFYAQVEHIFLPLRDLIGRHWLASAPRVMLNAGSGDGSFAIRLGEVFNANRLILVDNQCSPTVALPPHAKFLSTDVCSPRFQSVLFGAGVNLIVSTMAFHEFSDPTQALKNLLGMLPRAGMAIIVDYSEEGWNGNRQLSEGVGDTKSYLEDIQRARAMGVDTNAGIEKFWKGELYRFSGKVGLSFHGNVYKLALLVL